MKALVFFRWVLRLKLLLDTLKINFDEKGYAIKKEIYNDSISCGIHKCVLGVICSFVLQPL